MTEELKVAMLFAHQLHTGASILNGALNIISEAREHESMLMISAGDKASGLMERRV